MIYQGNDLYTHPEIYDQTFIGLSTEEPTFYKEYVKKAKNVLYFGSGSGRLLKEFYKVNQSIIGVEIMPQMATMSEKLVPGAKVICSDVLDLDIHQTFDLIIAPYRFFCHFNQTRLKSLFEIIKKHLSNNGLFIGDIFNPYLPKDHSIDWEFDGIAICGDEVHKVYNHTLWEKQLCEEYVEKNNTKTGQYDLVKMTWNFFYPEQLKECGAGAGLAHQEFFGSFEKEAFTEDSEDLIYIFKNNAP